LHQPNHLALVVPSVNYPFYLSFYTAEASSCISPEGVIRAEMPGGGTGRGGWIGHNWGQLMSHWDESRLFQAFDRWDRQISFRSSAHRASPAKSGAARWG